MLGELNLRNAMVFRIVHVDNVPWILDHGLHCRNSKVVDPNFVQIGNSDLIDGRHHRRIRGPYGGTLSDYVPFYFTPLSPMFLNIKTGWRGVRQRSNREIAILFTSLRKVQKLGLPFIFTDRHAYLETAQAFTDLDHLDKIDWAILRRHDFKRDPENPEKVERYEAEALIHKHLPIDALDGIACFDTVCAFRLQGYVTQRNQAIKIDVAPRWYF